MLEFHSHSHPGVQQPSKINYEISKSLRFQDFMFQDCNKISRLYNKLKPAYMGLAAYNNKPLALS